MPSAKRPPPRRALYCWSAEITGLRAACNGAKRQYTRSKRRRPQDMDRDDMLRRIYMEKRKTLRQAICRAKEEDWLELVGGSGERPLGPTLYTAPISETIQSDYLRRIIGELFPDEP
ncbi:unnamed protein product [Euphydryas editha]|uniref:Uncharacterized protein n=1 Tax=Euphydryas editha TaxID=104508 RepID=A0AAU9UZH9_EUPED|nr:unnamed protein product [Euphydryas editha]